MRLCIPILFFLLLGCAGERSTPVSINSIRGELRFEECDKPDADIRLDVSISQLDFPERKATISFYLKKVDYLGINDRFGSVSTADGVDSDRNWIYTHRFMDLSEIGLATARFEYSFKQGRVGEPPDANIEIDITVSLNSPSRIELENGYLVEASTEPVTTGDSGITMR